MLTQLHHNYTTITLQLNTYFVVIILQTSTFTQFLNISENNFVNCFLYFTFDFSLINN